MKAWTRNVASAALTAAVLMLVPLAVSAQSLGTPQGPVILTVSGTVDHAEADGAARFDHATLARIGTTTLKTTTPWTEGVTTFEGVLARDLMAALDAAGESVVAVALNDYEKEIPVSDFHDRDVLLAWSIDGRRMRVRDKGPLWIIYPNKSGADSQSLETRSRMIWQLHELRVQ